MHSGFHTEGFEGSNEEIRETWLPGAWARETFRLETNTEACLIKGTWGDHPNNSTSPAARTCSFDDGLHQENPSLEPTRQHCQSSPFRWGSSELCVVLTSLVSDWDIRYAVSAPRWNSVNCGLSQNTDPNTRTITFFWNIEVKKNAPSVAAPCPKPNKANGRSSAVAIPEMRPNSRAAWKKYRKACASEITVVISSPQKSNLRKKMSSFPGWKNLTTPQRCEIFACYLYFYSETFGNS